jgi:opacity protein-like surface antigen
MKHFHLGTCAALAACLGFVSVANAQSSSRETGWEVGSELIYQTSHDVNFEGGSQLSFKDDLGIAITFGYRFNSRLELLLSLDWQNVSYDATVVSDTPLIQPFSVRGDMEALTPRASVNFNFIDGPVTPFVTAGIGYSFIDTNIPDAPPQNACWWDPWFGHICSTFQSTRNSEEFSYQAGAGVRWDLASGYTMRLGYEKHWIDLGEANGTPSFDQFKLGFIFRY